MNRREFLERAAAAGMMSLLPWGTSGLAAFASAAGPIARKRLVVVMLRGAVDGLSVVVPYAERAYYEARPRIAIARPGEDDGAIDLDGRFGLHPALAPLVPLWKNGSLAFVHAAGSPDPTRSHFDAQAAMESATPAERHAATGWMNRLLAVQPDLHSPTQAVAFGGSIPAILAGRRTVANMALGRGAGRPTPIDRPQVEAAFARMYQGNDALSSAFREGLQARKALMGDLQAQDAEMHMADHGAPSPVGFAHDAAQLAYLLRKEPTMQLAFLDLGGWDTHVNQGAGRGQLANHLRPLAQGLATLAERLGDLYRDTTVVVISEFGRTVQENGNTGTDHGHGNVIWVMGGSVGGGKVYGDWPGLAQDQRYQGRDLAVTTDYRQVLGTVLRGHVGLRDDQLARVFPERATTQTNLRGLIRPV